MGSSAGYTVPVLPDSCPAHGYWPICFTEIALNILNVPKIRCFHGFRQTVL